MKSAARGQELSGRCRPTREVLDASVVETTPSGSEGRGEPETAAEPDARLGYTGNRTNDRPLNESSAATVEQRPCPWCKTPGYPDDPYCLCCGRSPSDVQWCGDDQPHEAHPWSDVVCPGRSAARTCE